MRLRCGFVLGLGLLAGSASAEAVRARLVIAGDVRVPPSLSAAGEPEFSTALEAIAPVVGAADLAIADLETSLGDGRPGLARALSAAGFDAVTRANEHALDGGEAGWKATTATLEAAGLAHTGSFASKTDRDSILVLEPKSGLRIALLAYSFGTNGRVAKQPWMVNTLFEPLLRADVLRARSQAKVDLVVVAVHVGAEFGDSPDAEQRRWIEIARRSGADVVIGQHPRLVQRAEPQEGRVVAYGLGALLDDPVSPSFRAGALLVLDVVKDAGQTKIERVGHVPTLLSKPNPKAPPRLVVVDAPEAKALASVRDTVAKRLGGTIASAVPGAGAKAPRVSHELVRTIPITGIVLEGDRRGYEFSIDEAKSALEPGVPGFLRARPGMHELVGRGEGLLDIVDRVMVTAERVTPVKVTRTEVGPTGLAQPPPEGSASLEVSTQPAGAVVTIDGRPVGRTPNVFAVAPGPHAVRLACAWCEAVERTVIARAGQRAKLAETLLVLRGSALIRARDAGVRVTIDGIERGVVDGELRVEPLARGLHELKSVAPGVGERVESIFVEGGEVTPIEIAPLGRTPGSSELLPAETHFSETHLKHFRLATHQVYGPAQTSELFERFRELASPVCKHLRSVKEATPAQQAAFLRREGIAAPPWAMFLNRIVDGCFNFFKMNDIRPDIDFELVRRLYPTDRKECFSVGFMQPYWMHTVFGCERLTMVDIDWRIQDGHQQMLAAFRAGRLGDPATFAADLAKVKIGWFERYSEGPVTEEVPAQTNHLCSAWLGEKCARVLQDFSHKAAEVKSVRLQVTPLHEADYDFLPGVTPVIYVSNALEAVYTTRRQFDVMMTRIARGLAPGGKAVVIYHAGGRQQFGVYEVRPKASGYQVVTLCRDTYVSANIPGGSPYEYRSWFEDATSSPEPWVACTGGGSEIKRVP